MDEAPKPNGSEKGPPPGETFPENASVTDLPPKRPSVWREFLKGCHDLFWQWFGLDKVAEDVNTHREAVRKGAALRFLLVVALLSAVCGFGLKGCIDASQVDALNEKVTTAEGGKQEAERDRDKYQIEAQNANNALAPWKELANSQYPGKPINEGLNALLSKVDALQRAMLDDSLNPLKEPIASAVVTATIDLRIPNPQGNVFGMGGLAALGRGPNELLMGATNQMYGNTDKAGVTHYRIVAPAAVDDVYMGKPVESLLDAQYMQVDVNAVPANTDVLGGSVVWVINNRVTLKFAMPPQKSSPQSHLFVSDLSAGMSVLQNITSSPPSSDASLSPH